MGFPSIWSATRTSPVWLAESTSAREIEHAIVICALGDDSQQIEFAAELFSGRRVDLLQQLREGNTGVGFLRLAVLVEDLYRLVRHGFQVFRRHLQYLAGRAGYCQ